jgi:hypothetical protein
VLPYPAAANSGVIIVHATTLRHRIHPYLIGSNGVEDHSAVVSPVDSLGNLDNALDVRSGQTRSTWANNFDLGAAAKKQCAKNDESAHET